MTVLLLCLTLLLTPWYTYAQAQQFDRSVTNANGLIAWWKAVPGFMHGPMIYDRIGRTHATLTNMDTAGTTSGWRTPTRPGGRGEVAFDGSNDRIALPVASYLEPPAMSMLLWMKSLAWGGDHRALFTINAGGGILKELLVDTSGQLAVYLSGTGGSIGLDPASSALSTGLWYHIAWSYSAIDGLRVYVNCQPALTASAIGTLDVTNAAGAWGMNVASFNRFFQGAMDDMRLYDRVVPQAELCTIMNNATSGVSTVKDSQPLGFVKFITSRFFPFFKRQ